MRCSAPDDTMVVIGRPESFDEIRRLVAEGPPD